MLKNGEFNPKSKHMLKIDNGIFEAVFPFFRAEAVETYGELAEKREK